MTWSGLCLHKELFYWCHSKHLYVKVKAVIKQCLLDSSVWRHHLLKLLYCSASKLTWSSIVESWHIHCKLASVLPLWSAEQPEDGVDKAWRSVSLWSPRAPWQSQSSMVSKAVGDPPDWLSPPHRESLCSNLRSENWKLKVKYLYPLSDLLFCFSPWVATSLDDFK